VSGVAGTFAPGEFVDFSGGSVGKVLGLVGASLVYELISGANPAAGQTLAGVSSGASATVARLAQGQRYVAETETAAWRVLDWATDLQVSVSNELQPAGGTSAMLDELGAERAIPGGTNEPADAYRKRVAQVSDVVSPNAIKRAAAKALNPAPWCYREAATIGFFFDKGPAGSVEDPEGFYDTNCLLFTFTATSFLIAEDVLTWSDANGLLVGTGYFGGLSASTSKTVFVLRGSRAPLRTTFQAGDTVHGSVSGWVATVASVTDPACREGDRTKVWLDYLRMRAYFQIVVQPSDAGEFGFAYDTFPLSHVGGFYDEKVTGKNFYDGYPWLFAQTLRTLWQDVEPRRAGGTYWDVIKDPLLCT
jgi:hypothetical protein